MEQLTFTAAGLKANFQDSGASYGNVLAANALVEEDLRRTELDVHDPEYELLITVRAVKRPATLL